MKTHPSRQRTAQLWALGILIVLVIEVAVCLILFLPQSRVMKDANDTNRYVEQRLRKLREASETFRQLRGQMDETKRTLAKLDAFTGRRAQDVVMDAIGRAADPDAIVVLQLAPEPPPAREASGPPADYWRLRCAGGFRDLVLFLARIERPGVLLDVSGFQVSAEENDIVEVGVTLKTLRPTFLSGGASVSGGEK